MKKTIIFILIFSIVFTGSAYASDTNVDGGGGNTGTGTSENIWHIGDDGVRVTVVKESNRTPVTTPTDFTNQTPHIDYFFGLNSKIQYNNGTSLIPKPHTSYKFVNPASPIPSIVTADGRNNITAIKEYFGKSGTIMDISEKTGFDYNTLINGDHVLLLEPLAYVTYNSVNYAMTATEAALFDQIKSGGVKSKLGFITHQNLPLSMFLERPDLGYPAWSGASSGIRANSDIISYLGIGTVRFTEGACCNHPPDCPCLADPTPPNNCECPDKHPDTPCDPEDPNCDCVPGDAGSGDGAITAPDYIYHTDTEVITSVRVYNNGSKGFTPDNPCSVTFNIGGTQYTKTGIVIPPDESTLVWVKWKTLATPQKVAISLKVSSGASVRTATMTADITKLVENTPPDPQPTDLKPHTSWRVPPVPYNKDSSRLTWGEWWATWEPKLTWVEDMVWEEGDCDSSCDDGCSGHGEWSDNGEWVDKGEWIYTYTEYYASASITLLVKPDDIVETAKQVYSKMEIKSGYGVNLEVSANVFTNANITDISPIQNVVATFPEFDYQTYNRILEPSVNQTSSTFELYNNKYSLKNRRSHYTPIWFFDDAKFEPYVQALDAWCPAGQLYLYDSDYVLIFGDVYDDWNISPVKEE